MMNTKIPIFILDLIVFPKAQYSLHIFENKYKRMLKRCREEKTGFGILTRINNKFSKIGSYVIILKVIKDYPTGESDIIVRGTGRFFMQSIELTEDGYYVADIVEYNDIPTEIDSLLLEKMQNKFEEIVDRVDYQLEDSFWTSYFSTDYKSFKLAEKAGLTIEQQQNLISMQNENERMNYLLKHFESLEKQISENAVLKNLILNDGYINEGF